MQRRRASSLGAGALVLGVGAAGLLLMLWAGQHGESVWGRWCLNLWDPRPAACAMGL